MKYLSFFSFNFLLSLKIKPANHYLGRSNLLEEVKFCNPLLKYNINLIFHVLGFLFFNFQDFMTCPLKYIGIILAILVVRNSFDIVN